MPILTNSELQTIVQECGAEWDVHDVREVFGYKYVNLSRTTVTDCSIETDMRELVFPIAPLLPIAV